jgi:flagellar P-ring protein precursor FlgI
MTVNETRNQYIFIDSLTLLTERDMKDSLMEIRTNHKKSSSTFMFLLLLTCGLLVSTAPPAPARTVLRNICRVKGQEENVLRGMGLVVGLNGTGASGDAPTMRALASAMGILGSPIPNDILSEGGLKELENVKNVSLVIVTARVPATGGRRGDKLDCTISAINGKSLVGGQLISAALQGPNTQDGKIYALAEGSVQIDDELIPTVGRIHAGCQMEEDVFTPFVHDEGFITLVLEKNHANFQTATDVAKTIRETIRGGQATQQEEETVWAYNPANIVVRIPNYYQNDPVAFISEMMEMQIYQSSPESRVVINERAGSIVIDGNVEIGDVVVSHKNIVIEVEDNAAAEFRPLADQGKENASKLKSLVDALGALKVPHDDVVDIIYGIERAGKLQARLIIE